MYIPSRPYISLLLHYMYLYLYLPKLCISAKS